MADVYTGRELYLEYTRPLLAVLAAVLLATSLSYAAMARITPETATMHRHEAPPPLAAIAPGKDGSLTVITVVALYMPETSVGEKTLLKVRLTVTGPRPSTCRYYLVDAEKAPSWLQERHPPDPVVVNGSRLSDALAVIERLALASAGCSEELVAENPPVRALVVAVYRLSPSTPLNPELVNGTLVRCGHSCKLSDVVAALQYMARKDPARARDLVALIMTAARPSPGLDITYVLARRLVAGNPAVAVAAGLAGVAAAVAAMVPPMRRRG